MPRLRKQQRNRIVIGSAFLTWRDLNSHRNVVTFSGEIRISEQDRNALGSGANVADDTSTAFISNKASTHGKKPKS